MCALNCFVCLVYGVNGKDVHTYLVYGINGKDVRTKFDIYVFISKHADIYISCTRQVSGISFIK